MFGLKGAEESLLGAEDLDCTGRVFCQTHQAAGMADKPSADELADDAKPAIIRAYLKAWAWEVGRFFDGLEADSSDADIAAVAAGFQVFRIG